ncbi:MAG TPA: carboxylesterase family protein, partial [Novosphingobium sp.]|nr:carboxylesterase family protein [Novosphingobium sp.]
QGTETAGKWGLTQATAAQLRALPADQITPYTRKDNVNFYLDGKTITEDMWASFRAGHEAPVPLLIGSNGLEFPNPARNVAYLDSYMTPDQRDKVIAAYGDTQSGYDHLGSDATFAEQARALARMHVRNGHKAYVYLFNAVAEGSPATAGAGHGSELRYVFDTLGAGAAPVTGAKAQAVATRMNAQWRAFARSRRPDGAGLPAWPAYDGCQILSITLDQMQAVCDPRNARLDVLSQMIDPKS